MRPCASASRAAGSRHGHERTLRRRPGAPSRWPTAPTSCRPCSAGATAASATPPTRAGRPSPWTGCTRGSPGSPRPGSARTATAARTRPGCATGWTSAPPRRCRCATPPAGRHQPAASAASPPAATRWCGTGAARHGGRGRRVHAAGRDGGTAAELGWPAGPSRSTRWRRGCAVPRLSSERVLPVRDDYLDRVTATRPPCSEQSPGGPRGAVAVGSAGPHGARGPAARGSRRGRCRSVERPGRVRRPGAPPGGTPSGWWPRTSRQPPRSPPLPGDLSTQRLVKQSGSRRSPRPVSLTESFFDDCSLVFRHTSGKRKGWVGYASRPPAAPATPSPRPTTRCGCPRRSATAASGSGVRRPG